VPRLRIDFRIIGPDFDERAGPFSQKTAHQFGFSFTVENRPCKNIDHGRIMKPAKTGKVIVADLAWVLSNHLNGLLMHTG
jgi:hypothetical protein